MRTLLAALLITLFQSLASGQATDSARSAGEIFRSDISAAGRDAAAVATAPLRFSARDWAVTAAIAGGTALLFTADRTARSIARRSHSTAAGGFADVGREYGREIYGLSLSGGLYAGGLLFGSDHVRTTGRMLFESVAIAGVVNMALKSLIGRSRPQAEEGPFAFRGLETELNHTSLPSGHTTVAFSVSSVLARRIGNAYATIGLYSLAGVTACSRVYHDNHWLSDTFLGAALGTAVGLAVTREGDGGSTVGLILAPTPSGLRATYVF